MSNIECTDRGLVLVKSRDGVQIMTAIMSGFLLFVIAGSFLFNHTLGGPYAEVMAKMFGSEPASFAGLGLLVMILLPNGLSFRGARIAFVLAATFTSFMWLSL